jgi:TonB family protein
MILEKEQKDMRVLFNRLFLMASGTFLWVSPLLAEIGSDRTPSSRLASWVDGINMRVDEVMTDVDDVEGQVTVTFRRADDGHARDIRITDGTPALDQAARTIVRRLGRLPPLPLGVEAGQRIRLQLLWGGTDSAAFATRRRALLATAEAGNRRVSDRLTALAAASDRP